MSFCKPRISFSSNFAWHFSVMKDKPSVLFRSNVIYFVQKGPTKVQIIESFECSDHHQILVTFQTTNCLFFGFFFKFFITLLSKSYIPLPKIVWRVMQSLKKNQFVVSIWWILIRAVFWFPMWHEEFVGSSPYHSNVWKCHFNGLFLSKVYKFWAKIIERSYLSGNWTMMQKLNQSWPCDFKNEMKNWVNFH